MTKAEQKAKAKQEVKKNGPKSKKKKIVDKRKQKTDKLRALHEKKSMISRIQPDKTDNTIDKLAGEIATFKQEINNRLSGIITDRNQTDALARDHDGVLQNINQSLQLVINDIATLNEKVDGIFEILLEPDEDEVEEEPKKEEEKNEKK